VTGFLGRIGRALARLGEPGPPRLEVLWPFAPGSPERIGLVSGSFDPMTLAHVALSDALGETADLVLFLYSPRTLPKQPGPGGDPGSPLLDPRDRVASLLAYCRPRPGRGVALCSHGLYADQAEAVREAFPTADIVFGMGSDKVLQLVDPEWYVDREAALDRLFSLARVVYAVREGEEEEERLAEALEEASRWGRRLEPLALPAALAGLSSRRVRGEVIRGRPVADLVPPEVIPFLERRSGERGGEP
jgi:nicotinic acid mononucleotide adenylyltransferase